MLVRISLIDNLAINLLLHPDLLLLPRVSQAAADPLSVSTTTLAMSTRMSSVALSFVVCRAVVCPKCPKCLVPY